MKALVLSGTVAAAILAGVAGVSAQSTTVITTEEGRSAGTVIIPAERAPAFRTVIRERRSVAVPDVRLSVGATLPESVELYSVPDTYVTEVPTVRSYRYAVINDRAVLVEPGTRRVVQVID